MDNPNWVQMEIEIESLCKLHNDAIANYEKCREFANRMSLFLSDLEDSGCNSLANGDGNSGELQPEGGLPLRESQHGTGLAGTDEGRDQKEKGNVLLQMLMDCSARARKYDRAHFGVLRRRKRKMAHGSSYCNPILLLF